MNVDNNNNKQTVMIIDDQATSRLILETIIKTINHDLRVLSFDNSTTALQIAETDPPDLVLADYKMPVINGVELTRRLRLLPNCKEVPIIIVTIYDDKSLLYQALEAGATEFLGKPVDHYECKIRCQNLLTLRRQQLLLQERTTSLEHDVEAAVKEIQVRERETLYRLAIAGDYKDVAAGSNLLRMGKICQFLARELNLPEADCKIIEYAAPMHDIGKIGVPDNILMKKGPLSESEFTIMKQHSKIGFEILKNSPSPYLQMGAVIALNHHEKFNGDGYPDGKQAEDIPLLARIATVADVFDALSSARPYKKAWPLNETLAYMEQEKGKHLDPIIVDALLSNIDKITEFLKT